MKKIYSAPAVELVKLDTIDIIATSPTINNELGGGGQLSRPFFDDDDEF